jgi:predicted lactoylglutathione lyase
MSPPPLANVLTIGVRDLPRQRKFYADLGWPIALDTENFVVFELRGALLALFPLDDLARDARAPAGSIGGGIRSSVIIIADGPDEVDAFADRVRAAGGAFTKEPTDAEFFEGRDAYFTDPEGNFWEIAWTPAQNPVTAAARRAAGLDGP